MTVKYFEWGAAEKVVGDETGPGSWTRSQVGGPQQPAVFPQMPPGMPLRQNLDQESAPGEMDPRDYLVHCFPGPSLHRQPTPEQPVLHEAKVRPSTSDRAIMQQLCNIVASSCQCIQYR